MEILFLFFLGLILLTALSSGSRQMQRPVRKSSPGNFRTYFNSLSEESQTDYLNAMDELQRLQFMEMLNNENIRINEETINEFNNWTEQDCNCGIAPYDNCDFEHDCDCDSCSSEEIKLNDNYYSEDSSIDYSQNDSWSSSDYSSDSSSFSDSGSSDSSSSSSSSDF